MTSLVRVSPAKRERETSGAVFLPKNDHCFVNAPPLPSSNSLLSGWIYLVNSDKCPYFFLEQPPVFLVDVIMIY